MVYSMRQTFECKWTGNTALNYDIQKKEVQPQSLYKQACYQLQWT